MPDVLYTSRLRSVPLLKRGKVRDIYKVDADHLLMVTSDRLLAFDVVLPTPIPGKGEVLNENISFDLAQELLGRKTEKRVRAISVALYKDAAEYAATRGIRIADKMADFGIAGAQGLGFKRLFMTHPPLVERIAALRGGSV